MTAKLASYNTTNLKVLHLDLPNLTIAYIKYITQSTFAQLDEMHIKATEGNDMLDWINQVGLENAMKLAHQLSMISIAALTFNANHYYNQSPARSESRMTQFFRLLCAMKGGREFYCKLNIDDYIPNQASIAVSNQEKVVDLTYRFGFEDFGEEPIVYVLTLHEEERYDESDDFQMLLLDIEKSSIGLQAINRLEMIIKRQGKTISIAQICIGKLPLFELLFS